MVWTYLAVAVAAAVWLGASAAVAFPNRVFHLDFNGLFKDFFSSKAHPTTVIILLAVDIIIAALFLKEARIANAFTGTGIAIAAVALIFFAVISMLLPEFNREAIAAHTELLGVSAYLLVGIPRAMSYGAPKIAKPVTSLVRGTAGE